MPAPGTKPIKIGNILVSALHLVGVVVLFIAVILLLCGMWSPAWSAWQGSVGTTHERKGTAEDNWYYYNGPWMKTVCSHNYQEDRDEDVNTGQNSNWEYDIWPWGTRKKEIECTQRVYVADHCVDIYKFDKCGHLTAVRVFTCIAMICGLIALVLSIVGIVSVTGPKYPCIGSCLLSLIAGLCIFIAICIWARIKDWEKEQMRIICSNLDNDWYKPGDDIQDTYNCWGATGTYPAGADGDDPCNDKCDEIDPPYGLAYAYILCIFAMLLFVIGGALNGAAGLNKRIPSK